MLTLSIFEMYFLNSPTFILITKHMKKGRLLRYLVSQQSYHTLCGYAMRGAAFFVCGLFLQIAFGINLRHSLTS